MNLVKRKTESHCRCVLGDYYVWSAGIQLVFIVLPNWHHQHIVGLLVKVLLPCCCDVALHHCLTGCKSLLNITHGERLLGAVFIYLKKIAYLKIVKK